MADEATKTEEPKVTTCVMCNEVATTSYLHDGDSYPCCRPCADKAELADMSALIEPHLNKLFDHVNGHSRRASSEAFIQCVMHQHRTLQQSFFSAFIVPLILKYADLPEAWYDLRNEATVKLCKRLSSAVKDSHLPLY